MKAPTFRFGRPFGSGYAGLGFSGKRSSQKLQTFLPRICFSTPTTLRIVLELRSLLTPLGHTYSLRLRSEVNSWTRLSLIAVTGREPNRGTRYLSKWLPIVSWQDGLNMDNLFSFHHAASDANVLTNASDSTRSRRASSFKPISCKIARNFRFASVLFIVETEPSGIDVLRLFSSPGISKQ